MKDLIEKALNIKVDYSDRDGCEKKLNECLNVIGLSAKHVSIAKGDLERSKAITMRNHPELNSRLLKMKIDANSIDEQQALELAERLWTGLHKTIDGLKSLLNVKEKDLNWS